MIVTDAEFQFESSEKVHVAERKCVTSIFEQSKLHAVCPAVQSNCENRSRGFPLFFPFYVLNGCFFRAKQGQQNLTIT